MRRKPGSTKFFLPNNPLAPQLCPELAKEIGLNESVLLLQLEFWMRTEGVERDGHLWLRKTVREIQKDFCFWSTGTVSNIILKLTEEGYMVEGSYDESPGKNGRWLAFDFEYLSKLKSIRVICPESEQPLSKESGYLSNSRTSVLIDKDQRINTGNQRREKPTRKDAPDPATVYRSEMIAFLEATVGPVPSHSKEGKALKWLFDHEYEPNEIKKCLGYILTEDWRTHAITWVTVQREIGRWRQRGSPLQFIPKSNGNGYGNGAAKVSESRYIAGPMSQADRDEQRRVAAEFEENIRRAGGKV